MEEARRQRLTARRKFQVYLETRQPGANAGEILRLHGLHLNDLRQIEGAVEQAPWRPSRDDATATGSWRGSFSHFYTPRGMACLTPPPAAK